MAASGASPARYDEWADWYERYTTGDARAFTDRTGQALAEILGRGTGAVLDVACGTGIFAPVLRSLGWTPLGLDLSRAHTATAPGTVPGPGESSRGT